MKAYLLTTGTIFGLIAIAHLLHAIGEWSSHAGDPGFILQAALGTVALALSLWAWRLLWLTARAKGAAK
jgi:hypothetical protein